jgi:hypothetical protein
MKRISLVLLIVLASCARYNAAYTCQDIVGSPPPNVWAESFGLVGALASDAPAGEADYNKKFDACMVAQGSSP